MDDKIALDFKSVFEATGFVLLDVMFKSTELTFLIDSGSDVNLIDIDLIKNKDKFEKKEGSYVSLGGRQNVVKFQGNFTFNIDEFEYSDVFTATDMSNFKESMKNMFGLDAAGIIGSHFLRKFNAIIDYHNCRFLLDAVQAKNEEKAENEMQPTDGKV